MTAISQIVLIFVLAVLAGTFFSIAYQVLTADDINDYLRAIERRHRQ